MSIMEGIFHMTNSKQTSELKTAHGDFTRGDFVKVLHQRMEPNKEFSDWWRPALWMGHDGKHHCVRYTDGTCEVLLNSNQLELH